MKVAEFSHIRLKSPGSRPSHTASRALYGGKQRARKCVGPAALARNGAYFAPMTASAARTITNSSFTGTTWTLTVLRADWIAASAPRADSLAA